MNPFRFGTDGVRGEAGQWPLDTRGATMVGRAVAAMLSQQGISPPRVVVGRDTRASGTWLRDAVSDGLVAGGSMVLDAGVVPTAAISVAIPAHGAHAGIVITASHNPATDNGLKVMIGTGEKLLDPGPLEALLGIEGGPGGGRIDTLVDGAAAWRAQMPTPDLEGLTLLLDCAHGAAASHAPAVLEGLGAQVLCRGCSPNGQNINDGVGALHPPSAEEVRVAGADLAICLDGDADRIVLVDPRQGVLDGDDLAWLLAGRESGPVVGTIMTNGGLEAALGDRLVRAAVGDRFVAEAMAQTGARVGAEPSGHVLFSDGLPTGDGLYTALRLLEDHDLRAGLPADGWQRWPSVLVNLRFDGERRPLESLASPTAAEQAGNRVVVRYSGTEPKVRILVEGMGQEENSPSAWAERIAHEFNPNRPES